MNAKGIFISALLTIDTFLVSFAVGFNSRHVLVVDPALPALPVEPARKLEAPAKVQKSPEKTTEKPAEHQQTEGKAGAKTGAEKQPPAAGHKKGRRGKKPTATPAAVHHG